MAKVDASVELFYSGVWNDVTASGDVYTRDPITISPRGRQSLADAMPSTQLHATLENRDGKYSPRNPTSSLYGLIGRNTPVRVAVGKSTVLADTFGRNVTNGWGTSDSGHVYTTFGTAADFDVTTAPFGHGTIQPTTLSDDYFATVDSGWTDANVVADFSLSALPATGSFVFGVVARYTDDSNQYIGRVSVAPGGAATLEVFKRVGGSASTVATQASGVTIVATTKYSVRFECYGEFATVKVWQSGTTEPTSGTQVLTTSFIGLAGLVAGTRIGVFARNNSAVTTHVLSVDDLVSGPQFRFHGEVESWPQRWSVKGDAWSPITAYGVMRRFSAPGVTQPADSAMRRAITREARTLAATTPLLAYWPLEDTGVVVGSPGIAGGLPTETVTAPASFGAALIGSCGATSGIDFSRGGGLKAPTGQAVAASPNGWEFEFLCAFDKIPTIASGATRALAHAHSSGPGAIMGVGLKNSGGTIFWADYIFDAAGSGATVSLSALGAVQTGRTYHVRVKGSQVGPGLRLTVSVDNAGSFADGFDATLNMPDYIALNTTFDATLAPLSSTVDPAFMSQLAFWAPFRSAPTTYLAAKGFSGELATARIARLGLEEGVTVAILSSGAHVEEMGVQTASPVLELMNDAANTDGGILYEPRHFLGLAYRTHSSLYDQVAVPSLNYTAGDEVAPPLEPIEDTDLLVNDVTVTRYQGGSARAVKETGPLNVQPPPVGVGRAPKSVTLSLDGDSQCRLLAARRRRFGTWDEARCPVVSMDLTAMAAAGKSMLMAQSASLDIGGRFSIANLPVWLPPQSIEQLAQGFVETLASHHWTIDANATPARPFLTPAFVSVGTAAHALNASVVPGLPAGAAFGDLLLVLAAMRDVGNPNPPTGYTQLFANDKFRLFGKLHIGSGEAAPTVTISGSDANAPVSAQMAAFRNVSPYVAASATQSNASAANIAFPGLAADVMVDSAVILYLGWREQDWTSVAQLSGAVEIGEPATGLGNNQGLVWDYEIRAVNNAAASGSSSFVVTGGVNGISRGAQVVLQ